MTDATVVNPTLEGDESRGPDSVPALPLERAREFARQSKAKSTLQGYKSDWRDFGVGARLTSFARCQRVQKP